MILKSARVARFRTIVISAFWFSLAIFHRKQAVSALVSYSDSVLHVTTNAGGSEAQCVIVTRTQRDADLSSAYPRLAAGREVTD